MPLTPESEGIRLKNMEEKKFGVVFSDVNFNLNEDVICENGEVNLSMFLFDNQYEALVSRTSLLNEAIEKGLSFNEIIENTDTIFSAYVVFSRPNKGFLIRDDNDINVDLVIVMDSSSLGWKDRIVPLDVNEKQQIISSVDRLLAKKGQSLEAYILEAETGIDIVPLMDFKIDNLSMNKFPLPHSEKMLSVTLLLDKNQYEQLYNRTGLCNDTSFEDLVRSGVQYNVCADVSKDGNVCAYFVVSPIDTDTTISLNDTAINFTDIPLLKCEKERVFNIAMFDLQLKERFSKSNNRSDPER